MKTALIKLSLVFSFTLLLSFGLAGEAKANPCYVLRSTSVELYEECLDAYNASGNSVMKNKQNAEDAHVRGKIEGDASAEHHANTISSVLGYRIITETFGPSVNGLSVSEAELRMQIFGKGAVPQMGEYIAQMYQPPASTQIYLADLFQSARIIPAAQAQGLGFASLNPILEVWKVFRNLAYFIFVIIFLVIGFMIMLHHKIGGQTAITVQQAIPNIIVALLFVTFSYAIGGLLIDLMYLFMYIIIALFGGSERLINQNFLQLGKELVQGGMRYGYGAGTDMLTALIDLGGLEDHLDWIGGLTVAAIVTVAVLFGVFKLFFAVLKSYVSIILLIAFSPLLLMLGALPGKNTFSMWIKNLIGNLSIFPVILILLIIMNIFGQFTLDGGGFVPPYLVGQGFGSALPSLVGVGILLAIPEIANKIKEAIGARDGVFGELASAAGHRAQSGELVLPLASTAVRAPIAGGRALYESWQNNTRDPRLLWQHFKHGYPDTEGSEDGTTTIKGGAFTKGKVAWNRGQAVRRTIDRAAEGRLLDAENIEAGITALRDEIRASREVEEPRSSQVDENP